MSTIVLKNGTGNEAIPNSGSTVVGNGLKSTGANQVVLGRFNTPNSTDLMQIGAGKDANNLSNAIRTDEDGITTIGGGEIYTTISNVIYPVYVTINGKRQKIQLK